MTSILDDFFDKGKNRKSNGQVSYLNDRPSGDGQVKITAQITGQVQGVGFRFSTQQAAQKLGVGGLVRNESDGNVYVEANADPETMDEFIERLRLGPSPAAQVDRVEVTYDPDLKERDKFTQANWKNPSNQLW